MVFPSSTWGKTFAIARTQKRTNEPDYIRVMAQIPAAGGLDLKTIVIE